MVTSLPKSNPLYENSLFSGVLGLSVNTTNRAIQSVVQYLKRTDQIENMMVSIKKKENVTRVVVGSWDKEYLANKSMDQPVWIPM